MMELIVEMVDVGLTTNCYAKVSMSNGIDEVYIEYGDYVQYRTTKTDEELFEFLTAE